MSRPIEVENSFQRLNMDVQCDPDLHSQFEQLCVKVRELEREKDEICENFDAQRGKLYSLYQQKEEELNSVKCKQADLETEVERLRVELDEAKSQLFIAGIVREDEIEAEKQKAQAEIATLNQIMNESVVVSTTSQTEVKKLKQKIQSLELQLKKLRGEKEKEGILLAPSHVLSGAKSLAKKVVGQLGNDMDFRGRDNLEDSMKKAQEDSELLRSLVVPLEQKIQELSEKLVVTEEKLKKYESVEVFQTESPVDRKRNEKNFVDSYCAVGQDGGDSKASESKSPQKEGTDAFSSGNNVPLAVSGASPSKSISCDMCLNYEAQLVSQQQLTQHLEKEKGLVEANVERIKEELMKETRFRKCMEDKWNEKKEEHKLQVSKLKSLYESAENDLKILRKTFEEVQRDVRKELKTLHFDRVKMNSELVQLQKENDNLVGKYSAHSEQLRNESINFPDNVEDLQELLLKSHEELIAAKVAKETKEEQVNTLKCEIKLLQDKMDTDLMSKRDMENHLALENSELREQLESEERERIRLKECIAKLEAANEKKERSYEKKISELQSRVGSFQQELETSETVQKDFVKLSQSLQMELEKIRGADTEVRWQHEDDATECFGCRNPFVSGKRKNNCRHCGKIFCTVCLSHVVFSGPRNRASQVCQVCHTLLDRESAPYFSQEPPHSPD